MTFDPISALREAVEALPKDSNDPLKNQNVQKLALECLAAQIWDNLNTNQVEELEKIAKKYSEVKKDGGFQKGRWRISSESGTQTIILKIFAKIQNKELQKSEDTKLKFQVFGKYIYLKEIKQENSTGLVSQLASGISSVLSSGNRWPVPFKHRISARLSEGTMSKYYDRKVSILETRAKTLKANIDFYNTNLAHTNEGVIFDAMRVEESKGEDQENSMSSSEMQASMINLQPNPKNLSHLMQETIDIAKELEELRTGAGWENDRSRITDNVDNPKSLENIQNIIFLSSATCFRQLAIAIKNSPKSYREDYSTTRGDRNNFDKRIEELSKTVPAPVYLKDDKERTEFQHNIRNAYKNFKELAKQIAGSHSTLEQFKTENQSNLGIGSAEPPAIYLDQVESAAKLYSEFSTKNPTTEQNSPFQLNMESALTSRLQALNLQPNEKYLETLRAKINVFMQQGAALYESDPENTKNCIEETLHAIISDCLYEALLDRASNTQAEYLVLQRLINRTDANWIKRKKLYSITKSELSNAIEIAKQTRKIAQSLFPNPYIATKENRNATNLTQKTKLEAAQRALTMLKTKIPTQGRTEAIHKKIQAEIEKTEELIENELKKIKDPQITSAICEKAISREKIRRNQAIVDRFSAIVQKKLQIQEQENFQNILLRHNVPQTQLKDIFTIQGPPSAEEWRTKEMQLWGEWLSQQRILGEIDTNTMPPSTMIEFMSLSTTGRAKLKGDFEQYLRANATFFGIMNQKFNENPNISSDELAEALKKNLNGVAEDVAPYSAQLFLAVKEKTQLQTREAQLVLEEQLFRNEGDPPHDKRVGQDLDDWEIKEIFIELGFSLNARDLKSILEINVSATDLEDKSKGGGLSPFYYITPKLQSIQRSSSPQTTDSLGGQILEFQQNLRMISSDSPREIQILIRNITQLKKNIGELRAEEEASKKRLEKACNELIIHAFLKINRFRINFNDKEFDRFSNEIDFEILKTLAKKCEYTSNELYEIYVTNFTTLQIYKTEYDTLLFSLAQGEKVDPKNLNTATQNYARALRMFETEIALIPESLLDKPKLKRKTLIQRKEFFEEFEKRPISITEINSNETYSAAAAELIFLQIHTRIKNMDLINQYKILAEDPEKILENAIKIAKNKAIIHELKQLEQLLNPEISKHQSLEQKIAILNRYLSLIEMGTAQIALNELNDLSIESAYINVLQQAGANGSNFFDESEALNTALPIFIEDHTNITLDALSESASIARKRLNQMISRDHLPPIMQQNILMGIRQRALEFATKDMSITFQEEANTEEDQIITNFLSHTYLDLLDSTSQLIKQIYIDNTPPGRAYEAWFALEISQIPPPGNQLNFPLEETPLKEILDNLSKALGQDPKIYNDILLNRYISFILSKQSIANPTQIDSMKSLAMEIDSIFFGEKWRDWVHQRCISQSAPSQGAQEERWKNGGVAVFQELNVFRADKTGDTLRTEFLQGVVIPAFAKQGKNLNLENANKLMNAMMLLQASSPSNEVSCIDFDAMPELKSLFFGKDWNDWVRDKCTTMRKTRPNTLPNLWGPGGIQYLSDLISARQTNKDGDGTRIQTEFTNNKVIPCLTRCGITNPETAQAKERIAQAIKYQKYGPLTSIKRKTLSYCRSRDVMPPDNIQEMLARYFQTLGITNFTKEMSIPLLLEMKRLYRKRQFESLSEDKQTAYQNLILENGSINQDAAGTLGFSEEQITALETCCFESNQMALHALGQKENIRNFDEAAMDICTSRLETLDQTLFQA